MVSKEFLTNLMSYDKEMDNELSNWHDLLKIDLLNSNLYSIVSSLETNILNELFTKEYVDIWYEYTCPVGERTYTKESPFMWDNNNNPIVWDDETFIDYMYNSQKEKLQ